MFADRKITSESRDVEPRDKLVCFDHVVCSYHGLAEGNNEPTMSGAIFNAVDSKSANVELIAEEIFQFLKNENCSVRCPKLKLDESGIHVAGFDDLGQPQIYHIFYNKKVEEVKKELYNVEHHDKNGEYFHKQERLDYFALFNGINCAVYLMQCEKPLDYEKLTFDEVIEEIKKQIYITFTTEPYSKVCGAGLNYVTIPTLSKSVGEMKTISFDEIKTIKQNEESIPEPKNIPIDGNGYKQYQRNLSPGIPPSGTTINLD